MHTEKSVIGCADIYNSRNFRLNPQPLMGLTINEVKPSEDECKDKKQNYCNQTFIRKIHIFHIFASTSSCIIVAITTH